MNWKCALAGAAIAMALTPTVASADAIGSIENARAKDRQGRYLSSHDREQLRMWGGGESGRYYDRPYAYRYYNYGYDDGPRYRYYRTYPY
jgi:hypothetical protein